MRQRPYKAFGYPVLPATLYRDGDVDLYRTIALQTSIHLAWADDRTAWRAGVSGVEATGHCCCAAKNLMSEVTGT